MFKGFFKVYFIAILSFILFYSYCNEKPTEPQPVNPLDVQNEETGGDPFQLEAAIDNGGVTLKWYKVDIDALSGYAIYRSGNESNGFKKISDVKGQVLSYTDKSVENGHEYWYKVTALNQNGFKSSQTNVAAIYINTNPLIIINGDNEYTSTRKVKLTILAAAATQIWISNDNQFTEGDWEDYVTTKEWELDAGAGIKSVYLKVKYNDDKISNISLDTIKPQPMAPTIFIADNSTYSATRDIILNLSAIGENLKVKVSNDTSFSEILWDEYIETRNFKLSSGEGTKTVYAKFKNDFEIESEIINDTIEPLPMEPTLLVAEGAQFTTTQQVKVDLSATGTNIKMQVSTDSAFVNAGWENLAETKIITLPAGDGTKGVYAKFKNDFDIETKPISDNVILDTTPPETDFSVNPETGITNETIFTFDASACSDNTVVAESLSIRWDWENDGAFDTHWSRIKVENYSYTVGGGDKIILLEVKDSAGLSNTATKTIYINTRPVPSFTYTRDIEVEGKINYDASVSNDYEDGENLEYRWDFDGDGVYDTDWSGDKTASYSFGTIVAINTILGVKDRDNVTNIVSQEVLVNNGRVTDIDGNVYKTIKIGDQIWMAENLKVTHYRDGNSIPYVTNYKEWIRLKTGAYCAYDNDENNAAIYGLLYNWMAVDDSRKIAPEGWHVPSYDEWQVLVDYLAGYAGCKLAGNAALWEDGVLVNDPTFGETGFCALPGGDRYCCVYDRFELLGKCAQFWTSSGKVTNDDHQFHPEFRAIRYSGVGVGGFPVPKQFGYSVRCIKD